MRKIQILFPDNKKRILAFDDRWITINGEDNDGKGQHVYIKENGDVIFGLGGKFKNLRDLKTNSAVKRLEQLKDRGLGQVDNPIPRVSKPEGWKAQRLWENIKVKDREKLPIQEVNIDEIKTYQTWVNKKGISDILKGEDKYKHSSDLPMAIKLNGTLILMDGNHRIVADILQRKKKIKIRVFNYS